MSARAADLRYYKTMYETIVPLPTARAQIVREASRLIGHRVVYRAVQAVTAVPWVFPACVHELECDCNMERQILNGEPWRKKTTLVPEGLGPWPNWIASAVDALRRKRKNDPTWTRLDLISDWTIPRLLLEWEKWNGGGYMRRGKHSPYLFAGSTHAEKSGYYTSDGKYSPTAKSKQIGVAVLLRHVIAVGEWASPMDF